jgi:L-lactate dehydrogenase
LTVSTYLEGEYGLEDVCLSLPTVVARSGAQKIIKLTLDEKEEAMLQHSAAVLKKVIAETGV